MRNRPHSVTTTYDALGRQKSVTNTLATSVFDYAADLGPDKETITYTLPGQSPFTRVLDRRDRSFGRDTGWELQNGPTLENEATYQYSATTGRLETVANSADVFTYGYLTHSSLLATVTKAASGGNPALVATRAYEPTRDTLASIENNAGVIIRSKYDYATVNGGVNSLGQRMGVQTTFNLGAGHLAIPGDTSWGYDNLGQLTSANHDTVDTIDRGYQYDTIGNRLFSEKGAPQIPATPGLNTTGYTADALNQYDAITPYDASGVAGTPVAPVFDFDGNMTTGPLSGTAGSAANHLDWDAENRLVQVRAADDTAVITSTLYDAQSRRIATTTGGITTLYLYDGFNCIAEYTQSVPAVSAVLSKTRLWGLDLSGTLQGAGGVGGLLAEKQGANTLYPTYDGNGNVSEYLEADGDVAAHFEYDPFGNIIKESYAPGYDATSFTYKFSTKPLDLATGLYYYQYRWYDPLTGRWPSRDPIEEAGGLNLYGFVGNNGISFVDRLGLELIIEWVTSDQGLTQGLFDGSGQMGATDLFRPRISSAPEIEESSDKKCAWVKEATETDVRVRVRIGDIVGLFATLQGHSDVVAHEGRRVDVATKAYYATFGKVESSLSKKCGVIKREAAGKAKQELQEYLDKLWEEAQTEFLAFYDQHNGEIDNENISFNQRHVNGFDRFGGNQRLFDGYINAYEVPDFDGQFPQTECPD